MWSKRRADKASSCAESLKIQERQTPRKPQGLSRDCFTFM
jgi:hypothetical protein